MKLATVAPERPMPSRSSDLESGPGSALYSYSDNEYSDSEESSTTTTTQRLPKDYQHKSYYNKFSYSSQSTPRRRYQHDGTKSTRSSSTASETKITFNEDEYTKITTPRQDVLFKKGYLNKPRNYQTQTSTGTSTTSTGNSTGNGTPDHQSTDLEYESQFVFPNGFVDQNGIYYINSYETYPLMLYNPPTYYPECSNFKSKRCSTGSLTESMSPNNEEATSQDFSGGEAANNVSDYSGHHQVYNMVYPGYYVNGACPPEDATNGQNQTDQTRRIKKRRRRKTSKSQTAQDSSEYTEDEDESSTEESRDVSRPNGLECQTDGEKCLPNGISMQDKCEEKEEKPLENSEKSLDTPIGKTNEETKEEEKIQENGKTETGSIEEAQKDEKDLENPKEEPYRLSMDTQEFVEGSSEERSNTEVHQSSSDTKKHTATDDPSQNLPLTTQKSDLKPDAEEFIPRAYRGPEIPINPNLQFIKVPPSFIPIPIMPLQDFNGQNYNPAFIPPGIPINFLPPDPKMYPNFVGFVPNPHFVPRTEPPTNENGEEDADNNTEHVETCDNSNIAKEETEQLTEKVPEKPLVQHVNTKTIDIATIVSKLEEAAKEQDSKDTRTTRQQNEEAEISPKRKFLDKNSRVSQKYKNIPNYRRNNYSNQNSPQRNVHAFKEKTYYQPKETISRSPVKEITTSENDSTLGQKLENVPNLHKVPTLETKAIVHDQPYVRRNQENTRKNWKYQNGQNGSPRWQQNSPVRAYKPIQNGKPAFEREYKPNQQGRNHSATLKLHPNGQKYYTERSTVNHVATDVKNEIVKATERKQYPNQWISVSSRKKRKNKSMDESDDTSFDVQEDHSEKELFEKYDVDQLVDVVPQEIEEVLNVETAQEIEIGDIINTIAQSEEGTTTNLENISLNVTMRSVEDVEKELIVTEPNNETEVLKAEEADITLNEIEPEKSISEAMTETNISNTEGVRSKSNKKSKKGVPKTVTKRVIITDVDLSMNCEEIKPPLKKIVTKVSEKLTETVVDVPVATEEKKEESPKREEEEEKKKSKKKKKKSSKPTITNSLSSSSATINNMDDSYDFLLDSALSSESVEKTNDEISEELDKMIQKGMYSNLEEKIKLLNIDDSGGFFKSVLSNISGTKSTGPEKNGFNKTLDLSKILQDTRSPFRPSSVSEDSNSQSKETNEMLPDLDSAVEDGFFLEKTDVTGTARGRTTTNEATSIEDTKEPCDDQKTLYPITAAVKEWMCKTRETTPDVEILKSPDAIYKEFCDSTSDTDTVVSDSTAIGDEEVTIFTQESESISQQEDSAVCETGPPPDGEDAVKDDPRHIEEGEDVLETYDSKYGTNEDYLNLQKEVREKVTGARPARHGNLPYRAICCNLM